MTKKRTPKDPPQAEPEITVEEIGSSMTARIRTTYRGAAAGRGLRELLERPTRGPFGDTIDTLRAFLADATAESKKLEYDSMEWYGEQVLKELERAESHLARAADAAGKLSKRSSRINKAIAEGLRKTILNASYNAALAAYRAGTLNQEARGKSQNEGPWIKGNVFSSSQSEKAKTRGKQITAEKKLTPAVREALRAKAAKMKTVRFKRSKARLLIREFPELSFETIRKNI